MQSLFNKKIIVAALFGLSSHLAFADGVNATDAADVSAAYGSTQSASEQIANMKKSAFKKAKSGNYPVKDDIFSVNKASSRSPFLDTKQAVFQYDPNESYPVVTRAGQNTYIDMPEGVTVSGFYLSNADPENWLYHVTPDKKQISIQPVKSGNFDSASIVTNKYKMLLAITSTDQGQWFQNVKWVVPKKYMQDVKDASPSSSATNGNSPYFESYAPANQVAPEVVKGVDADSMNTRWSIEGEAPFKPLSVYNDQDSTYIEMPPKLAELPALFSLSPQDEPELVNYTLTPSGRYKVNKVLRGGLLKLGKQEVRLTNLTTPKPSKGFVGSVTSFFGGK